jgi:hypothetical protein
MRRRICCTVVIGAISTKLTTGQRNQRTRTYGSPDTSPSSGIYYFSRIAHSIPLRKSGPSLRRLRLNRPPLVAYRLRKQNDMTEHRLLARYYDLTVVLEHLHQQQAALLEEQQALLEEQRRLVQLLLRQQN